MSDFDPVFKVFKQVEDCEPGDLAAYFIGQEPGAIPNGTRIRKDSCEAGDSTPVGSCGWVLSSIATLPDMAEKFPDVKFGYFVVWDRAPSIPVFVLDWKIVAA